MSDKFALGTSIRGLGTVRLRTFTATGAPDRYLVRGRSENEGQWYTHEQLVAHVKGSK